MHPRTRASAVGGHAVRDLVERRGAHANDGHDELHRLAGKRMVAIDGKPAVPDARDAKLHVLAALVLEHHFGAEPAVLRRHVADVVGKREFGLVLAEAVLRRQQFLCLAARLPSSACSIFANSGPLAPCTWAIGRSV